MGNPDGFRDTVQPMLAQALQQAGLKPSMAPAIAAQMALETGYGRSVLGNNLGNIKADKSWNGATVTNPGVTSESNVFRSYANPQDAINDYVRFIVSNPRYAPALSSKNPAEFFSALQSAGYATDKDYAQKLAGTFSKLYPG
jgi:flagellar protein FlgJ